MYRHLLNLYRPLKSVSINSSFKTLSALQLKGITNRKLAKSINREYSAVCALLHRSGLNNVSQLGACISTRRFHCSPRNDQQEPFKQGNSGGPNKPDNGDEDKDKISSLVAKAFLWMLTAYMVIAIISLMFPNSSQPEVVRYVSWNEFLYQMLAKGEVEQIIVRPDIEIVTIILYEGAIIKGKKNDNSSSSSSDSEENDSIEDEEQSKKLYMNKVKYKWTQVEEDEDLLECPSFMVCFTIHCTGHRHRWENIKKISISKEDENDHRMRKK